MCQCTYPCLPCAPQMWDTQMGSTGDGGVCSNADPKASSRLRNQTRQQQGGAKPGNLPFHVNSMAIPNCTRVWERVQGLHVLCWHPGVQSRAVAQCLWDSLIPQTSHPGLLIVLTSWVHLELGRRSHREAARSRGRNHRCLRWLEPCSTSSSTASLAKSQRQAASLLWASIPSSVKWE